MEMMDGFAAVGAGLVVVGAPSGPPATTKVVFLGAGGRVGALEFLCGSFGMDGLTLAGGTAFFVRGSGFVADGVGAAPVMALLGRLCGLADVVDATVAFLTTAFLVGGCVGTCGAWGNFRL